MSRVELDAIQTKLKAAILNHQMLVKKMKGDKQNPSFKSALRDVQEEIKRLSEEQKKIVVKLRENLVKSTSLPVPPHASSAIPVITMGQTITAIGQPRLVSFSSQGGATILPVGMLAVPIAHVQRPALGVALNPSGQMCAQANLSLQPADYASAMAAAGSQIPAGLFNSGQAIPINSTIAIQNSIAINNITSAINVSSLNGGLGFQNLNGGINLNTINSSSIGNVIGSGVAASQSIGNIVIASKSRPQVNCSTVSSTVNNNNQPVASQSSSVTAVSIASALFQSSGAKPVAVTLPNTSPLEGVVPNPVTVAMSTPGKSIVVGEQPLVQPHLLHQQQQQILQMIQLQQPPQRLASHFPIKVPQYTASPIRTVVSSTSVQYCNIAPAPMPFVSTCSVKPSVVPTPAVVTPKSDTSKSSSVISTSTAVTKEIKIEKQDQSDIPGGKKLSGDEKKKLQFMQALDLYTPEALRDLLMKRNERKRRTTANPQYSIGFESNRRHRNGNLWEEYPVKRARVNKGWKGNRHSGDKPGTLAQNGSTRAADNHEDFCAACGKGGQLLMCETCRLVYHLDCLKPPLTEAPKYAWSCPKCLVSGKGSAQLSTEALSRVHSYIGKRATKEDERKKLQRKRNEVNYEKSFLDNRSKKLEVEMKDQKKVKARLEEKENESKKELQKLTELIQSVRQSHSSSSSSDVSASLKATSTIMVQSPLNQKISPNSDNSRDISSSKRENPDVEKLKCDKLRNSNETGGADSPKPESNVLLTESKLPSDVIGMQDNSKCSLSVEIPASSSVEKGLSDFQVTTAVATTSLASGSCLGLLKEVSVSSDSSLPVSMQQQCL